MANTEERMDVVIMAIYDNFTMPADWDATHNYEWKPNVSIQYKRVDSSLKPMGEELKARSSGDKNIWVFQAMGGKKAKGHFYDMMFTHGETNGTAWTSFKPLMELYTNGSNRRIAAPVEGADPPPPDPPPPGPKPPVGVKSSPTPATNGNGAKMPKGAEGFLEKALTPQTDAWWALKEAFNLDGAIISNSFQYAATFLQNFQGDDAKCQDAILRWAGWFETIMREEKAERCRTRLTMLLGLAVNRAQVTDLVTKGWGMLPKSHYEMFREVALARLEQLPKTGNGEPQSASPVPESEPEEASVEKETEEDIPF
jgi:hypothetical protein